tara:strand:- start:503 stop:934 length:432 start_codon:yes stop_codon:yes gene_type:complete
MANIEMKSLTILVIDDEPFMNKLIGRALNDLGVMNVLVAENGAEAIETLTHTSRKIDVIICDLEMPEMNGFEFVRNLRQGLDIPDPTIPVIILTGHSQADNIKEVVNLGISGFLTKPVSIHLLETRITSALTSPPIDPKVLNR